MKKIVENPYDFVDALDYSWERFFTNLIIEVTKGTPAEYSKRRLKCCYFEDCYCCNNPCKFKIKGNKVNFILGRYFDKINFSKVRKKYTPKDKSKKMNLENS